MTTQACPQSFLASIEIRGLRLLNLALEDAVTAIESAVLGGQKARIAFVNADCVNIAAKDETYRDQLAAMDWVFVDGVGMRIAGRLLKQPVCDNVNGTDLFPLICAALARHGRSIYLLGGRPGVAKAAADWASAHNPGLRIAGSQDGYFDAGKTDAVIADIQGKRPDVLLVAMGVPVQENWMTHYAQATGATVTLGVGGLFDFYSGRIPRAPLWIRRIRLEWVFRLWQEPGRLWRRYLVGNFVFLARVGRDWLGQTVSPVSTRDTRREQA